MVGSLTCASPASTRQRRTALCSASHILWLPDKSVRNPGVASQCAKRWLWHCRMCTYAVLLLMVFATLCCSSLAFCASGTLPCSRLCSNVWADRRLTDATFPERRKQKTRQLLTMTDHVKPVGQRYLLQRDSRSSEAALDKRHSMVLTTDLRQQFGLFYFERWATGQILTRSLVVLRKSTGDPAGSL